MGGRTPGAPPLDPPMHTPGQVHPLGNACWDTVNERVVRILLECILVVILY